MAIKSISSVFHASRNTVRKYVRKYQESGLTPEQLITMSEEKLQEMFLDDRNRSRKPTPRKEALEALVPDYVKRLSRKGVTVKSLHGEYLWEHPDGYLYSNFKRAIRQYKYQVRAVGHVEHPAGDQMYVDYAGDKLEIADAETGEVRSVVDIIYDADTLQIFHGLKLVTVHQRDDTPYAYTQKEVHNLPGRHGSYEKDLEEIYERAGAKGSHRTEKVSSAGLPHLPRHHVAGGQVRPCATRGSLCLSIRGTALRLQRGQGDTGAWR